MLAITGEARSKVAPEIPTFKELGYPDMTVDVAYFLLVAKGTPPAIVDKLHGAIDKAMQNPKIKEALGRRGQAVGAAVCWEIGGGKWAARRK